MRFGIDLAQGPDFTAVHMLSKYARAHPLLVGSGFGKLAIQRQVELENEVVRFGRVYIKTETVSNTRRVRVPLPIPARVVVGWWLKAYKSVSVPLVGCVELKQLEAEELEYVRGYTSKFLELKRLDLRSHK